MIGYYVHHVGSGHVHRACAIAAESTIPIVGLSSLARPEGWRGDWLQLSRDDVDIDDAPDATAGGRLHWVPSHHAGLRARMAALSAWIHRARPRLIVADVSVEVAVLARLHGVPVVSVLLPGRRDDEAHVLGHDVSSVLLAAWPESAAGMAEGLPLRSARRMHCVGGLSRFPVVDPAPRRSGPRRVTALLGRGGGAPTAESWRRAQASTPEWQWSILGRDGWAADPSAVVREADVVVCQAGQNSIAEVAAARRPALVLPAARPHGEQRATARVLERGEWPVVVDHDFTGDDCAEQLSAVSELDGERWAGWCDGLAAARAAEILAREHGAWARRRSA